MSTESSLGSFLINTDISFAAKTVFVAFFSCFILAMVENISFSLGTNPVIVFGSVSIISIGLRSTTADADVAYAPFSGILLGILVTGALDTLIFGFIRIAGVTLDAVGLFAMVTFVGTVALDNALVVAATLLFVKGIPIVNGVVIVIAVVGVVVWATASGAAVVTAVIGIGTLCGNNNAVEGGGNIDAGGIFCVVVTVRGIASGATMPVGGIFPIGTFVTGTTVCRAVTVDVLAIDAFLDRTLVVIGVCLLLLLLLELFTTGVIAAIDVRTVLSSHTLFNFSCCCVFSDECLPEAIGDFVSLPLLT